MTQTRLPRIVMLGPPGAGKSTQGNILSNRLSIPRISTGEMLREEMAAGTPLGQRIRTAMDNGRLVSDQEVDQVLQKRLAATDCQPGWILDGYPRRISQVATLERWSSPSVAILIHVGDDLAAERMTNRRVCTNGHMYNIKEAWPANGLCLHCHMPLLQRTEDAPAAIAQRLRDYRALAEPIANHYLQQGLLLTLDGSPTIDAVTKAMLMPLTTGHYW